MTVLTGPIYARLPRNSHPLRRRRRRDADALFPHRFHCVRERLRDNPVVSSLGVLWRRRAALEALRRLSNQRVHVHADKRYLPEHCRSYTDSQASPKTRTTYLRDRYQRVFATAHAEVVYQVSMGTPF